MGLLAPGTVFAGHRIESLVGRGGMGVVYRARHLELDRVVALKVIAPELLEDPGVRERFVREARTAASIEHPNVIPLHYAGEEDGIAYLAMRFVDGDDVRSLVRRDGVMAPGRAAEIVAQAGAALDAIHAAGFVHRDVKPANLLLAAGDHVYLSDFGLAKQALTRSGATRSGHWVGTLDYVAPEQIRGGRIDARADVYALGGVLHFMLTAHIPFDRESDEAKLWAHLADPPPLPSRLRAGRAVEFDAVVGRAMAKDPDARHPSAGDLGRAALAAARGAAAVQPERMVARGAASPEGAARQPGLAEEVPTLTGTRPAPEAVTAPDGVPGRVRWRWRRPALVVGGCRSSLPWP
jgi:serine/threonine protein kinase